MNKYSRSQFRKLLDKDKIEGKPNYSSSMSNNPIAITNNLTKSLFAKKARIIIISERSLMKLPINMDYILFYKKYGAKRGR
jgi:hypothetical protein